MTESNAGEVWRPFPGREGEYEISSHGRVKSLARTVSRSDGRTQFIRERIRKVQTAHDGRQVLVMHQDGIASTVLIHRVVAFAFLGNPAPGQVVCHNDGNPKNNRPENLRWDTPSANQMDRLRHGTDSRGERHNMVKLAESEAVAIRAEYAAGGVSQSRIAKLFGISQSQVSNIVRGARWCWLESGVAS